MSFGPPEKGEQSGILLDVNESPNFWCSQSLHIQREEGGKKREEKKRNLSRTKIENGFNFEQPLFCYKTPDLERSRNTNCNDFPLLKNPADYFSRRPAVLN